MNKNLKILECTLRDGSYAIDYQFTAEDTAKISKALEDVGFEYIEVGHGVGLGASEAGRGVARETDETYLKVTAETLTKAKFGMFFIPWVAEKRHLEMASHYGMDFVRIGTHPAEIDKAKEFIFQAKKLGIEVHLNFMKTYAVPFDVFIESALIVDKWGVDVLCVVDSAGCMMPDEVGRYIKTLKEKVKAKVGFHGHNNLQLVVANALSAIENGVDFIDSSLRGMGRSAGNVQTEILLGLFEKIGHKTGIDLYKTMDIAENLLIPLMKRPQGMSDIEVISGLARFHSYFFPLFNEIAKKHNIDVRKLIVEVCQQEVIKPSRDLIEKEAKKLIGDSPVSAV